MQYFRPEDRRYAVGDCIPFFHNGVFHLFYLLDEGHHNHPLVGGLGGHQWAHASSADLRSWTHHPLAIPCDYSCEGSICTGSLLFHDGVFHAFYALRTYPAGGEYLCVAKSPDGIRFDKPAKPFLAAPEGYGGDLRDPFVFRAADGVFHMLVTSRDRSLPAGLDGCLLHLVSRDLSDWSVKGPFLRTMSGDAPECPDLFEWNGWHYLLFGLGGATHYRMGRTACGPWETPSQDILDCPASKVMKTASWKGGRRIAVGWVSGRNNHYHGVFGGRAIFREVVQNADGTLGTTAVPEMELACGEEVALNVVREADGVAARGKDVTLSASGSGVAAVLAGLPKNFRLEARVARTSSVGVLGLHLGAVDGKACPRHLEILPLERKASLNRDECAIGEVAEIADSSFALRVIGYADIVDVHLGGRRTMVNCLPGHVGDRLVLYAGGGDVRVEGLRIWRLQPQPPNM